MNENAKTWAKALRSKEYPQTRGVLQRTVEIRGAPIGFCCLGVACDLYIKAGNKLLTEEEDGRICFESGTGQLPTRVMEWLGLTSHTGMDANDLSLAYKNDNGATFDEIADIIESEPEGLFVVELEG